MDLLSRANWRSPLQHMDLHAGLVVLGSRKISDLRDGMVVLRSMSLVKTLPRVSMPSDSGVTSSRRTSFTSALENTALMPAPMATTSSGFTPDAELC